MGVDVSVIIPTYNRLWCLPKAIESCRHTKCQTEIIVVDDGSTDGTWDWLTDQNDVVALRQTNQGQTWAINRGTAISKGRYIRFLDSDDVLFSGIIDQQFEAAITTIASLVYSRVDRMLYPCGTMLQQPDLPLWDDFLIAQLGEGYSGHFLGMLFRRDLVEKVPRRPDFAYREDRMFLLEVGLLKPALTYVPGCAGYWVQHEQQMQSKYRGLKACVANWQHLHIFKYILNELEQRKELTVRHRKISSRGLWTLAHSIAYTHLDEACEVVKWIYELDPDFQPTNIGLLGKFYKHVGFQHTEIVLSVRRQLLSLLRLRVKQTATLDK
jgi:glycosyltransferase involved in cell wall biosynthesis